MPLLNKTQSAVIVLLFASILWGLSWIPLKFFKQAGIEGMWLLFLTHSALAVLFIVPGFKLGLLRKHLAPLAGIGLLGGSAILLFTLALTYGDVVRVMVLFYLLPVWGVFGGKLFLGETLDRVRWVAVVVAVVGAFIFLVGDKLFSGSGLWGAVFSTPLNWVDLLALLSGLFFAANNLLFRGVESVPVPTKLLMMFIGCASISGLLIVAGAEASTPSMAQIDWIWLGVYTLFWLLLANLGSQWAVTQMEAGRSSIIIIMELIAAVLSTLYLSGENLSYGQWAGCFLVVGAGYLEATRSTS